MTQFLLNHWLAFLCLFADLGLATGVLLHWRRRGNWAWEYYLPAAIVASFGVGVLVFALKSEQMPHDYLIPPWISLATFLSSFVIFVLMLVIVIATGFWSAPLGYGLMCTFFVGLGGATVGYISDALHIAGVFLVSLRPQEPWWLLLLILVPVLVYSSYANMISLGATRRWLVLGFRCSLIALVTLALAETYARKPNENVTVIFVWDRSFSMPPEIGQQGRDQREERIYSFINDSVARNSSQKRDDRVGVIVFGKEPRLELPPNSVTKLGFKKIHSPIDQSYTDIAGAMKLALASFPEGSGKRIVLISDGNENMGRVEEQARIAKQNGVEVDIVPIAEGRKQINEILIERIEAPPITEKDTRLPLRVVIRSFHPQIVVADLNVRKLLFDPALEIKQDPKERAKNTTRVKLHQGLNVKDFQQAGAKDDTVFAYEATVIPRWVETHLGAKVHNDLPGDRVDNNEARVCVMTRGQRAILILEDEAGNHQLLVDRLKSANPGIKVVTLMVNDKEGRNELRNLTKGDNERLATFLSKFDAVFLANVPADFITPEEQQVIRSHVHDQGAGLVMIGGNQSFGAGGWQNTEIEKTLPVNMELKSMKIEGKSGLVLIMHASEMAEGNAWQRKIAKLAIDKLSPMDMLGQIHYDYGINGGQPGHKWHIPFQEVGTSRNKLKGLADRMEPGDMPDVDPAFSLAYKELTNPEYKLGTKHIILISDGDHWDASQQMINQLRNAKITVTTVCITTHGQAEITKMGAVARATLGRPYHIKNANELPAIYIKETRLVSQSFVHEGPFVPRIVGLREGPTESLQNPLQPLWGFVRTTRKESPTVRVLIETPALGEHKYTFPILAAWQYGLGKSIAFTSDARTTPGGKAFWDKDWASSVEGMYTPFWSQLSQWVLRPTETGKHLFLTTEHRDGKIRIVVETLDSDKSPLTDVEIKAGITTPAFKVKDDRKFELKFDQKNAGVWEAEIPADEVGAYFINIQAKWKKDGKEMIDTIRSGVSIPYSPEFAEMDSNPGLLDKVRELTGGKAYHDDKTVLEKAASDAEVFRSVPESHASLQALWPWLVFFAAICLLFDVALRRIAIQPEALWARSVVVWQKLRGQAVADESMTTYIERLKSRKASVGEAMDKQKAGKKYEACAGTSAPAAPIVVSTGPLEKPKPTAKKQAQEEEADFATRLMRAKKKAMEERDKDKK
ncbi:MAG: VWA domain-containing protein [Gemmataceae bacterium]|nr:VWA domain-containing protein [Gemmataceae bacterium]